MNKLVGLLSICHIWGSFLRCREQILVLEVGMLLLEDLVACSLLVFFIVMIFFTTDCREMAAESIYKERCVPVNDGPSWAKYMSISGSSDDEYDIITLQYTEEGLLTVDENREGHAAAFGDDIAIECLATEFKREIYVVRRTFGS